jgi:hypothetical protein
LDPDTAPEANLRFADKLWMTSGGSLRGKIFSVNSALFNAHESERGCVGDQPQHVQTPSRLILSNAPSKAKLLRLVSATQPRSKNARQSTTF